MPTCQRTTGPGPPRPSGPETLVPAESPGWAAGREQSNSRRHLKPSRKVGCRLRLPPSLRWPHRRCRPRRGRIHDRGGRRRRLQLGLPASAQGLASEPAAARRMSRRRRLHLGRVSVTGPRQCEPVSPGQAPAVRFGGAGPVEDAAAASHGQSAPPMAQVRASAWSQARKKIGGGSPQP